MPVGDAKPMSTQEILQKSSVRREAMLFVGLLIFGIVFMPSAAYLIGQLVFGHYAGDGFSGFFSSIGAKLLAADRVAWLLVASPYLVLQCLRLTAYGWRQISRFSARST